MTKSIFQYLCQKHVIFQIKTWEMLNFQIWVFNDPFNQIIKKYIIIKLYNAMMTFLTIYNFRKIIN